MLIRQCRIVVRGHLQRDEQQLDHISHRPRASSGLPSCSVVGVWVGFLRWRLDRCGLIVCLPSGHYKRSFCCFGWLTGGGLAMIADDVAVARMMSGEMSTDRMLIRQRLLVVRGHLQRD
jgi:hypothetical protein